MSNIFDVLGEFKIRGLTCERDGSGIEVNGLSAETGCQGKIMRVMSSFIFLFLLVGTVVAEEVAPVEDPKAVGTIYATIEISEGLAASFVEGPTTELPENIVAQVKPAFMTKARNAHAMSPLEDGLYRLAIDWKVVNANGQDQMKFEYRNSEPTPVRAYEPAYPRTDITAPVEVSYRLLLSAAGEVIEISSGSGNEGNMDFYRAGRTSLRRWTFAPRYEDGIAVGGETDFYLTFQVPCDGSSKGKE